MNNFQTVVTYFIASGTSAIIGNFLLKSGVKNLGGFALEVDKLPQTFLSMATNWQIVVGFVFYGLGSLLYLKLLSLTELSKIYPPLTAYMLLAVMLIGIIFLHESITLWKIIGTMLILAGVFCVFK